MKECTNDVHETPIVFRSSARASFFGGHPRTLAGSSGPRRTPVDILASLDQSRSMTNENDSSSPEAKEAGSPSTSLKSRALDYYQRNEAKLAGAFFVGGFLFDVLTLSQIDDFWTLVQQAVYLMILGLIIATEIEDDQRPFIGARLASRPGGVMAKIWAWRELVVHFLFGSLLSVYTLFFFKSSSFESAFVFLALLTALMVANELERFQKLGPYMRLGLWGLCFTCFLCYVFPIVFGFVGFAPFLLAIGLSSLVVYGFHRFFSRQPSLQEHRPLRKWVLGPGLGIQAVFLLLYVFKLIPPVPLSAQYMGIYHRIEKAEGKYLLSYDRAWWKFWQKGAQTFDARAGDKVHVFARVFAPKGFRDEIRVRWLYDDPRRGWQSSDSIPLTISGGREAGFRGFAYKQNFQPGDWMVKLETTDGREISRIRFEVVPDAEVGEREFRVDVE